MSAEIDALMSDLGRAGAAAERDAEKSLERVADRFRDDAKSAAPVDSGDLRNSIVVRGSGDSRTIVATAKHARFMEYGTSTHRPQPYMWPQVPRATKALADLLADIDPFRR